MFLIWASGSGKTTVARILAGRSPWSGNTHHFDSIGVPTPEVMEEEYGGGEAWQEWATREWIDRLSTSEEPLQLLEGQTRPSFIHEALAERDGIEARVVLLDCSPAVRRKRLLELRDAPHLDTPEMYDWAAYLLDQARALGLPVIDTSELDPEQTADEVESLVGYGTGAVDQGADG